MKEININDFGIYEIELERRGFLRLIWFTSIWGYNMFTIYSWRGRIFESADPQIAIKKFNEMMQ